MKNRKKQRKTITGTVVNDRMDKTIMVEWETRRKHPIYGKFIKRQARIKAHDEKNEAAAGDLVRIVETRPISKNKFWRVVEILKKAQGGAQQQ